MAKATSFSVGNREDLTDFLTVIEPQEYPLSSLISKGPGPKGVYHEWQVDNLDNPRFDGVAEGADVDSFDNQAAERARIGNYIQKVRRSWMVSDIQESVDTAGVPSEVANSKAKTLEEVKRDIEAMIGSDQDRSAGPTHKSRGLGDWIDSSGPVDVDSNFRTPSGSINATQTSSLTEANINSVLQSIYETYGAKKNMTLVAGPALKKQITGFTLSSGSATARQYQVTEMAKEKTITFDVNVYDGPHGIFTVVGSVWLARTSGAALADVGRGRGYLINPGLLSIDYMKRPGSQELDNEGGGRRGYVDTILTLTCKNPKGLGKFNPSSI